MSKLSFEFKCIFYFLTLGLFCGHLTCSCERRPRPHRDDDEFVDVTVACDENSQIQAHTPYRLRNLILWRSALLPLTSVAKRTFWQEPFWKSGSSSISGADKKQTLSVALVLPWIWVDSRLYQYRYRVTKLRMLFGFLLYDLYLIITEIFSFTRH